MTTVAHNTRVAAAVVELRRQVVPDLAAGVLPLLLLSCPAWLLFDLPATYLLYVLAGYAALVLLVLRSLPPTLPKPGFGPANRITLGRSTLILPVAALTVHPAVLTDDGYWWIIGVSTVALVLDGVDGWVARRTHAASSFGARFDMELDSFLMLALSVLVWQSGKVGPWAIGIGLPRYLFVAAGWIWPVLQGPLPPSMRRKTVCVIQGIALLVCLGPIIPPTLAVAVAAGAVLALAYSFWVDIAWLVRHAS